ncbi:hypothetical protein Thpro_021669 [Acidihalobacter prosperus]|uniref:DUF6630 domain-containing protein n=2 Tax=Acidihalobacter prosperus TaxID=160660 RepID=A0A1A6C451_9GAMM|nr:hypothetical protein Thpro_021669 [Acidihalobacter prosperus]
MALDPGFLKEWESGLDFSKIERGGYIREKITVAGRHLEKQGVRLTFINVGDDAYRVFAVRADDVARLPMFDEGDVTLLGGWFKVQFWYDPQL